MQMAGFHQETPGAYPEVIASMVNYIAKPEAYFVTGMHPLQDFSLWYRLTIA